MQIIESQKNYIEKLEHEKKVSVDNLEKSFQEKIDQANQKIHVLSKEKYFLETKIQNMKESHSHLRQEKDHWWTAYQELAKNQKLLEELNRSLQQAISKIANEARTKQIELNAENTKLKERLGMLNSEAKPPTGPKGGYHSDSSIGAPELSDEMDDLFEQPIKRITTRSDFFVVPSTTIPRHVRDVIIISKWDNSLSYRIVDLLYACTKRDPLHVFAELREIIPMAIVPANVVGSTVINVLNFLKTPIFSNESTVNSVFPKNNAIGFNFDSSGMEIEERRLLHAIFLWYSYVPNPNLLNNALKFLHRCLLKPPPVLMNIGFSSYVRILRCFLAVHRTMRNDTSGHIFLCDLFVFSRKTSLTVICAAVAFSIWPDLFRYHDETFNLTLKYIISHYRSLEHPEVQQLNEKSMSILKPFFEGICLLTIEEYAQDLLLKFSAMLKGFVPLSEHINDFFLENFSFDNYIHPKLFDTIRCIEMISLCLPSRWVYEIALSEMAWPILMESREFIFDVNLKKRFVAQRGCVIAALLIGYFAYSCGVQKSFSSPMVVGIREKLEGVLGIQFCAESFGLQIAAALSLIRIADETNPVHLIATCDWVKRLPEKGRLMLPTAIMDALRLATSMSVKKK